MGPPGPASRPARRVRPPIPCAGRPSSAAMGTPRPVHHPAPPRPQCPGGEGLPRRPRHPVAAEPVPTMGAPVRAGAEQRRSPEPDARTGRPRARDDVRSRSARRRAPPRRGGGLRDAAGAGSAPGPPGLGRGTRRRARRRTRPFAVARQACRGATTCWSSCGPSRRRRSGGTRWRSAPRTSCPCPTARPGWSGCSPRRWRRVTAGRRRGAAVAVVGGCGGAGASVLAAALAVTAVRHGGRALLVDCDPLGGGLDLVLGAEHVAGLRWPDDRRRRRARPRRGVACGAARAAGHRRLARASWRCSRAIGHRTAPRRPPSRPCSRPDGGRAKPSCATCPATPPRRRSPRSAPST